MRTAIFVDAGYLFAQGSTALTGAKKPRSACRLNETAALAELTALAHAKTGNQSILRTYWYDGAIGYSGPTAEQITLAHLDGVKLRLGFVNSMGQQKGVDSLIVTDLIDLARNGAICDAVLLSGDEDVRIGVQIAQSFGVRVHLIGIIPSRGSQSRNLLQESDTTSEWDQATVAKFLSVQYPHGVTMPGAASPAAPPTSPAPTPPHPPASTQQTIDPQLDRVVQDMIAAFGTTDVVRLKSVFAQTSSVPPEYDGKILARGRAAIQRDLSIDEKRQVRRHFIATIKALP